MLDLKSVIPTRYFGKQKNQTDILWFPELTSVLRMLFACQPILLWVNNCDFWKGHENKEVCLKTMNFEKGKGIEQASSIENIVI